MFSHDGIRFEYKKIILDRCFICIVRKQHGANSKFLKQIETSLTENMAEKILCRAWRQMYRTETRYLHQDSGWKDFDNLQNGNLKSISHYYRKDRKEKTSDSGQTGKKALIQKKLIWEVGPKNPSWIQNGNG